METVKGAIVVHFDLVWLLTSLIRATSDKDVRLIDVEYSLDEVRGRVHIHLYLRHCDGIISFSIRHLRPDFPKNRLYMGLP